MSELTLKYYIFDWDDNILFMPTRIHLQLDGEPIDVTTKEYAELRHDKTYQLLNGNPDDAFSGFRDGTGDFVGDTQFALDAKRYAPSFAAFKRALLKARLFCIVTARGHSSATIRAGVETFISTVFSEEEQAEMVQNIQTFNHLAGLDIADEHCLARYLDLNGYVGVSSPGFLKVFEAHALSGLDSGAANPENAKSFAVRQFVIQTVALAQNLPYEGQNEGQTNLRPIAFGFSDDDPRNLATVRNFLETKLTEEFPNVDFFVYDTSGKHAEVEQL
ncbi:MAG: hypothetical protein AB8G95_30760 [Anaerolineae bacterium]